MASTIRYRWFVKGDLDGFFGLAVDNLVQVLVIVALCTQLCGFTDELVYHRVLPGIAVSLLIGNLYYALHARRVARRDGNPTCTALPYGINTPSVFAYILFILAPVYQRFSAELGPEQAGELAWKVGLVACIGSGVIEFLGAFIGGWVRRVTPRAALLSALAAIGVIFIASPFAFQIYERPLVAMVPLFVVLIGYFARVRFPLGMPSGLVALALGTILAWTLPLISGLGPKMMSTGDVTTAWEGVRATIGGFVQQPAWNKLLEPHFFGREIVDLFRDHPDLLWSFLGVIVPMGLINAIGSLQNIESAEAAGDRFSTGPCMAVNGVGTIAAGLFGSCFPTTIYIGHPGWKALGARCGYSIINGLFFTVVFILGLGQLTFAVIPMEAGMAIVLYIGVIIAAQSYEAVPTRHYPAVALGFFPAVAMMAVFLMPHVLQGIGASGGILPMIQQHGNALEDAARRTDAWWPIGVYALAGANSGFVITGMIISAITAFLIDRRFKTAGIWCLIAAVVTLLGFHHAYRIEPGAHEFTPRELLVWQRTEAAFDNTPLHLAAPEGTFFHRGYRIAAGYALAALLMFFIHAMRMRRSGFTDIEVDIHGLPPPPEPPSAQITQKVFERATESEPRP
ncbi:MAG TPA: NCS2 family permease [Phycisphaerae bacterium]|nr:NCS2 family permease [Phycisphaerae bacterium]